MFALFLPLPFGGKYLLNTVEGVGVDDRWVVSLVFGTFVDQFADVVTILEGCRYPGS